MITLNDLKRASEKLDDMYLNEVLPRVNEFRKTWNGITKPLLDGNLIRVADRHHIDFVPAEGYAQHFKDLCRVAKTYLNVAWRSADPYISPHFSYNSEYRNAIPDPTLVEVCGHSNQFGFFDGTLWSVIKGRGWINNRCSDMNKIQDYLIQVRTLLKSILDQFDWFSSNVGNISLYISNLVNRVADLDANDTDEFNKLFDLKPSKKRIVISVKIEEVDE